MKIVIVGGHLAPTLAVLEGLPKDSRVLFIGRKYTFEGDKALSLEYREITKRNIHFAEISTGRWQRKFTRYTIPSLLKIPYGFVQSFIILRNFKPDVVLSFGGYLSLPLGLAAFILRIPIVIHEQTLERGLANKILSIFAKKVCISWESSFKYFPRSKTVLTGNPVRKFKVQPFDFAQGGSLKFPAKQDLASRDKYQISSSEFISHGRHSGKPRSARRIQNLSGGDVTAVRDSGVSASWRIPRMTYLPILYITGGSSGSHYINGLVEGCLEELLKKFVVIHQTGDAKEFGDFERLQMLRESSPSALKARYTIVKFVEPENIGSVLQRADLVVSRAGINTITELIFFKKPSLLVPIPFSQRNEQVKNALFLKSLGLAEIFYQETLDSKKFLLFIEEMFNNKDKYKVDSRKRHSGPLRQSVSEASLSRISLHREGTESDSGVSFDSAQDPQNDEIGAAQKIIEVLKYAKKKKGP